MSIPPPSWADYETMFLNWDTALVNSYGGYGSNCYVNAAEFAAFMAQSMEDPTAYTLATTPQRMSSILEATRQIDTMQYVGHRYFVWQSLMFPRRMRGSFPWYSSIPPSSYNYEQQRMAMDVKRANCIQALYILRNGGRNVHLERRVNGIAATSQEVGPVREFYKYNQLAGPPSTILSADTMAVLCSWMTQRRILRG